jgi:hypothetical protein
MAVQAAVGQMPQSADNRIAVMALAFFDTGRAWESAVGWGID